MTDTSIKNIDIRVSSRILRHISRGIYRSPAGALKELVSNSYDSGAQKVTINTSYPVINKIVVTDNGKGISYEKFVDIMSRIGFSEKDLGDEIDVVNSSKNIKRKIIGHYGIGFMAIGQLGKKATITSKLSGELTGIKATLNFEQFETHNIGHGKTITKAKDEAKIEAKDNRGNETVPIGKCELQKVNYGKEFINQSFTKVELTEIREDVKVQISGEKTSKLLKEVKAQEQYSASFQDILELLRESEKKSGEIRIKDKKVPRLREYFYEMLLWELSVYAPVPYPDFPVFQKGELCHFRELADNKDFELNVDGFVLSKPYEKWFFEKKNGFLYKIYKWEDEVYHENYKTSGYIIYQPGTMIRPKVLQGVLVRENFVAVGLYDKTFLNYPFNEGTKFNSLTGEIYASGLSGAMNIDRDSFNQTAEEYTALTEWFHNKLYSEVFPDIKRLQKQQESPSRLKSRELVLEVLKVLTKNSSKIKKVKFKSYGKKEKRRVIVVKDTIFFNSDHKDCDMNIAKREKLLFAAALIIKGYINEKVMDEISDEIEQYKKQI